MSGQGDGAPSDTPDDWVLAVDVGGTHMRAAVVDGSGTVLDASRVPTPHGDAHPSALVDLVASLLDRTAPGTGAGGTSVTRAVVGLPGQVNYGSGALEWAPHLPPGWLPELTAAELSETWGLAVALANDADLAAVGEAYLGAGRGFADVVYVTISTGIGAGVVLGGKLVHGLRSLAEVGHTIIDRSALEAGAPATLEDQCSGSALARMAGEAGLAGGGAEVCQLAARGDPVAASVWARMVEGVAIGLANLAELFCPEVIVVGGGVGLSPGFLDPVRQRLAERRPAQLRGRLEVTRASLGDEAGLAGAAAWHRAG